jgi:hypothetical protein
MSTLVAATVTPAGVVFLLEGVVADFHEVQALGGRLSTRYFFV